MASGGKRGSLGHAVVPDRGEPPGPRAPSPPAGSRRGPPTLPAGRRKGGRWWTAVPRKAGTQPCRRKGRTTEGPQPLERPEGRDKEAILASADEPWLRARHSPDSGLNRTPSKASGAPLAGEAAPNQA